MTLGGNTMNRKWSAFGILLIFLGTCIIPSTAQKIEKSFEPTSRGRWLYVGGTGPGNYSRILDAVNDARNGDTIFVYDDSAPYKEGIHITKSISLCGEERTTTIILGTVNMNFDDVTICNFTVDSINADSLIGGDSNLTIKQNIVGHIFVGGYDNVTVASNIVSDGMDISSSRVTITGNTISDGSACCYLLGTNNCTISGNNLTDSNYGVLVDINCQHVTIVGNTFSHCSEPLYCWGTLHGDIRRNTFINNPRNTSGIILNACQWTQVVENNFINTSMHCMMASELWGSHNVWDRNYWGNPRLLPKPIYSSNRFILHYLLGYLIYGGAWEPRYPYLVLVPLSLKYDWHPAQKPYDIR